VVFQRAQPFATQPQQKKVLKLFGSIGANSLSAQTCERSNSTKEPSQFHASFLLRSQYFIKKINLSMILFQKESKIVKSSFVMFDLSHVSGDREFKLKEKSDISCYLIVLDLKLDYIINVEC
jgi:hypothetical protein